MTLTVVVVSRVTNIVSERIRHLIPERNTMSKDADKNESSKTNILSANFFRSSLSCCAF